ncbi:unnamed protein product, partial [Closterium sp. Naga37s-1]
GPALRQAILNTTFEGLTGRVSLTPHGDLQADATEVLNVVNATAMRVGFWTPAWQLTRSLKRPSKNQQEALNIVFPGGVTQVPIGAFPKTKLRLAVPNKVVYKQFVNISKGEGKERFSGFCIDVFRAAVAMLPYPLDYEFVQYGEENVSPSYNQMVLAVADKKYDGAIGDITVTETRNKEVFFTYPIFPSGLGIMGYAKENSSPWLAFQPFTASMWGVTMALCVLAGLITSFLDEQSNEAFREKLHQRLQNAAWFGLQTLYAILEYPVRTSLARLFVIVFLIVGYLIVTMYTANLTSIVTVNRLKPSAMDIGSAASTSSPIGYQLGSFINAYLQQMGIPANRLVALNNEDEYVEALTSGRVGVIVDENPYLELFSLDFCDVALAPQPFSLLNLAFAFPKGSQLGLDISQAIVQLSMSGKLQQLREQHFSGINSSCTQPSSSSDSSSYGISSSSSSGISSLAADSAVQLSMHKFLGLYIIFGSVSLGCCLLYVLLLIHRGYRASREAARLQDAQNQAEIQRLVFDYHPVHTGSDGPHGAESGLAAPAAGVALRGHEWEGGSNWGGEHLGGEDLFVFGQTAPLSRRSSCSSGESFEAPQTSLLHCKGSSSGGFEMGQSGIGGGGFDSSGSSFGGGGSRRVGGLQSSIGGSIGSSGCIGTHAAVGGSSLTQVAEEGEEAEEEEEEDEDEFEKSTILRGVERREKEKEKEERQGKEMRVSEIREDGEEDEDEDDEEEGEGEEDEQLMGLLGEAVVYGDGHSRPTVAATAASPVDTFGQHTSSSSALTSPRTDRWQYQMARNRRTTQHRRTPSLPNSLPPLSPRSPSNISPHSHPHFLPHSPTQTPLSPASQHQFQHLSSPPNPHPISASQSALCLGSHSHPLVPTRLPSPPAHLVPNRNNSMSAPNHESPQQQGGNHVSATFNRAAVTVTASSSLQETRAEALNQLHLPQQPSPTRRHASPVSHRAPLGMPDRLPSKRFQAAFEFTASSQDLRKAGGRARQSQQWQQQQQQQQHRRTSSAEDVNRIHTANRISPRQRLARSPDDHSPVQLSLRGNSEQLNRIISPRAFPLGPEQQSPDALSQQMHSGSLGWEELEEQCRDSEPAADGGSGGPAAAALGVEQEGPSWA